MGTIDELKLRANIIKQEEEEGKNTALRVGGLLYDTLDYVEAATGGDTPTPSEKTSVTVTPIYSGGTQVARITVDGVNTELFAPSPTTPTPPYDDTAVRNAIDNLNSSLNTVTATVSNEQTRLDGVIDELDTTVSEKINVLYNEAQWIQEMFPEHEVTWQSGWDEKIEGYLQRVGVWARNNNITKTQWSNITQRVDSLELSVNELEDFADDTVAALSSSITQSVNNGIASLNLDTTYTKKDAENVLEWMYSALKSSTSPSKTYNQIVSGGQAGMNDAVAEIRTQVERLDTGEFVASASFETQVENTIAGLYTEATPSGSTTSIFSSVKKNAEDISAIVTSATGDSSSASINTKFQRWKAGLVTTSSLEGAMAGLIAEEGPVSAAVVAKVNDGISTVTISADQINMDADFINALSSRLTVRELIATKTVGGVTSTTTVNGDGIKMQIGNAVLFSANVTGQGSLGGGVITWESANNGKVKIGSAEGTVEFANNVTIPNLKATNGYGGVYANSSQGLVIKAPDNGVDLHTLNIAGQFTLGGKTLYYPGGDTVTVGYNTTRNLLVNGNLTTTGDAYIDELEVRSIESPNDANLEIASKGQLTLQSSSDMNIIAGTGNTVKDIWMKGLSAYFELYDSFEGTLPYTVESDERLKDIKEVLNPDIEDISKARIVNYTLKDKENSRESLGSIAQDWLDIFPYAVPRNKDGYYGLDYGSIALASAVAAAREIVTLKEKIRTLEERLERLENQTGK